MKRDGGKTRERSKRSRLTSPFGRSSRISPSHRPISGFNCCQDSVVLQERKHRCGVSTLRQQEKEIPW
ncbi:hypothetical protein CsSME_00035230 [Camellia sinensis var. sinensis]